MQSQPLCSGCRNEVVVVQGCDVAAARHKQHVTTAIIRLRRLLRRYRVVLHNRSRDLALTFAITYHFPLHCDPAQHQQQPLRRCMGQFRDLACALLF